VKVALDDKTSALVLIGALIAQGAEPRAFDAAVASAVAAGAVPDEVVDTLLAVSATVGVARVVSATPALAGALGYDIDAAFEDPRLPLA
jgi:alkylhydroperoxidase/carboxymuconolactone decarboxylase family protein YurZ